MLVMSGRFNLLLNEFGRARCEQMSYSRSRSQSVGRVESIARCLSERQRDLYAARHSIAIHVPVLWCVHSRIPGPARMCDLSGYIVDMCIHAGRAHLSLRSDN